MSTQFAQFIVSNKIHLRQKFESGNRVWIRNECQTSSGIHHIANIVGADFVRQVTQNTENRHARQQRRECVQSGNDGCISIHIVIEFIERWVHNQIPETHGQREKATKE